MRTTYKLLIVAATSLAGLVLSVFILTRSAPAEWANLTGVEAERIGTAIGGLTTPVIGLVSILLLCYTLLKQIEGSREQRIKNDVDFILMLLNQLQEEIKVFYYTETKGETKGGNRKETVLQYTGHEALGKFVTRICYKSDASMLIRFGDYTAGRQISLLVSSFKLIEERVGVATITPDQQRVFEKKLFAIYAAYLMGPFSSLVQLFRKYPVTQDKYSAEVEALYLSMPNDEPTQIFKKTWGIYES